MAERKKVYAVSKGEYSDYHVLCTCDDRETAERFAKILREAEEYAHKNVRVEELLHFDASHEPRSITVYESGVTLNDDFTTGDRRDFSSEQWDCDTANWHECEPNGRPSTRYIRFTDREGEHGWFEITGTDEAAVKKAMSERLAAFKAKSWIPQGENCLKEGKERRNG